MMNEEGNKSAAAEQQPNDDVDLDDPEDQYSPGDQLPAVEEVQTDMALSPQDSESRRKRRKFALYSVIFLVVLSVALIIGFATSNSKQKNKDMSSSSATEGGSSSGGSSSGGSSSGGSSGGGSTDDARLGSTTAFLLNSGVSAEDDLSDTSSPQYRAAKWIADEDKLQLSVPSTGRSRQLQEEGDKFVQRYSLAVLFYALNGEQWLDGYNFLSEKDECMWYNAYQEEESYYFWGAHCEGGTDADRVSQIWMPANQLDGTLPKEMEQFTNLRVLALEYNGNITGTLPEMFGGFADLGVVVLSNNMFSGTLPKSMKKLKSLDFLALDDNALTGDIHHIKDLSTLSYLYLEDNMFTGEMDVDDVDMFAGLPNLIQLDVSDNAIAGVIPASLLNHESLQVLDLHGNDISGFLPTDIDEQTTLTFLALHDNAIKGPVPAEIANFKALIDLDLANNRFTGDIVSEISQLTNLQYLFLGDNAWNTGEIPSFIGGLTKLSELSLKRSSRTGSIPDWIGTSLPDLYLLDLDGNELEGEIPSSLGNLAKLLVLMLNRNKLEGTVPENFADMKGLGVLLLDGNGITGDFNFLCEGVNATFFALAADCGGDSSLVTCDDPDCCNICCDSEDAKCDDMGWTANYDPIWELNYERYRFEFDLERRSL